MSFYKLEFKLIYNDFQKLIETHLITANRKNLRLYTQKKKRKTKL